ncbi:MAG TPA: hypothetical protein PKE39_14595 [Ignavibacteria bacterium]|nr:hypothetical protein [Ignavibacteria bacterium]HMR00248.1 hypothetical protein [Ignavibacteria bacterium]
MSKNIIFFRVIVLLVLAAFMGCVTSKIEYVESSEFPKGKTYRISEVFMNDGTVIILKDKEPEFKLRYKGNDNVIVYYEEVNIEKTILLKDISRLKIEVLESNTVVNVLIIVSSVILFFLILFWIASHFKGMKMG